MNTTPIPSSTSPSATYLQELQLLHQIQNHTMPASHAFLLNWLLNFPLPKSIFSLQTRLNLYTLLSSPHVPILSQLSQHPIIFSVLILAWPIWLLLGLILIYFLMKAFLSLIQTISPILFARFIKRHPLTFLELIFPSNTAKSALATEQLYKLLNAKGRKQGFLQTITGQKKIYSLEIVSSRDMGIRYIMVVPKEEAGLIHQNLLAYLPGLKVKEVPDYLESELGYIFDNSKNFQARIDNQENKEGEIDEKQEKTVSTGVVELALGSDFALPLQNQKVLDEHDPISFLTGNMTKLYPEELIAFQIISTPLVSSIHSHVMVRIRKLKQAIAQSKPLIDMLQPNLIQQISEMFPFSIIAVLLKVALSALKLLFLFVISIPSAVLDTSGKSVPILISPQINLPIPLNTYEKELHQIVKDKLNEHLFETSVRVLIVARDRDNFSVRTDSITASVGPFTSSYQSLVQRGSMLPSRFLFKQRVRQFRQRELSNGLGFNPILSASELADLYHFPYTDITKVEGLVKSKVKDLPAPLSMKQSTTKLNVIVGNNSYGGENVPIGLTLEQRERHTYVIGKTGMGKTEMLKNMIYQDMAAGYGLAVLDPHGDLFYELLRIIPQNRIHDVVVFNPADKDWPVGLNILSSGISFSDIEEGRDKIVSTVLAIFQKITDEKYWGPRLEHILRNATQTTLFTPTPSFWIIQKLLTSGRDYQKQIASVLKDPVLKQFWEGEFMLLGKMQQSETVSPVTNRIGKFITSIMSRNILLQSKSTLNIQEIMDEGKILLVNLSKGELGEDQSHFFGSLITSLIQLSAYQRIHTPEEKRRNFFLYVDEFQNFATRIFEELSSEGRKWHVPLIPSHQNIAQIRDTALLKIVAGNADTIIALKSGPDDEKFILPFMEPEVEKGGIVNLPPYHFYMKVTNKDSEDAFSGVTALLEVEGSDTIARQVTEYSRKHYATPKKEVEAYLETLFNGKTEQRRKTYGKKTIYAKEKEEV